MRVLGHTRCYTARAKKHAGDLRAFAAIFSILPRAYIADVGFSGRNVVLPGMLSF